MPQDYPLSDLKVLDLSRVLAGPFAGRMLSDLGARRTRSDPLLLRGRGQGGRDRRPSRRLRSLGKRAHWSAALEEDPLSQRHLSIKAARQHTQGRLFLCRPFSRLLSLAEESLDHWRRTGRLGYGLAIVAVRARPSPHFTREGILGRVPSKHPQQRGTPRRALLPAGLAQGAFGRRGHPGHDRLLPRKKHSA